MALGEARVSIFASDGERQAGPGAYAGSAGQGARILPGKAGQQRHRARMEN